MFLRHSNGQYIPEPYVKTFHSKMPIEYGRFDATGVAVQKRRRRFPKLIKPRQEICAPLKWFCFSINCVIFVSDYIEFKSTLNLVMWSDFIGTRSIFVDKGSESHYSNRRCPTKSVYSFSNWGPIR